MQISYQWINYNCQIYNVWYFIQCWVVGFSFKLHIKQMDIVYCHSKFALLRIHAFVNFFFYKNKSLFQFGFLWRFFYDIKFKLLVYLSLYIYMCMFLFYCFWGEVGGWTKCLNVICSILYIWGFLSSLYFNPKFIYQVRNKINT